MSQDIPDAAPTRRGANESAVAVATGSAPILLPMAPASGTPQRLFIHVGVPKSGTSFLQAALRENQARLRQQGVLYPSRHKSDIFHAALDVNGNHEHWRLSRETVQGTWARMCRRVTAFDGTSVISSEFFCAARPEQIERALSRLEGVEVHVIVTGRDMARQIPAEWQEGIKHGRTLTFGQFQRRMLDPERGHSHARRFWRYQDLPQVLERWAGQLSDDRVHLVTCPPSGADPALLWARFCSVIGLDPASTQLPASGANTSLGITEIEVLRRVNRSMSRTDDPRRYLRVVKQKLVREVLRNHASARATTPPELLPTLEKLAQDWRTEIERHGYDIVGDLHDLDPVATSQPAADPDDVPAGEALDVSSDAIAHLLTEIHGLLAENRELRGKNRLRRRQQDRRHTVLHRIASRAGRSLRR
jgi:hypothetical protein